MIFFFFNSRSLTQFSVVLVDFLSSPACTAYLVKVLAPRSARKKRKQRPLIRLPLLRCSKDAPSSREICSLISAEAVSIPFPPERGGRTAWFSFVDLLFHPLRDSHLKPGPGKNSMGHKPRAHCVFFRVSLKD